MNGTTPDGSQQTPSSRSSALLWTVAVVGVLGGLGLYFARGDKPATAPPAALEPAPIAAVPDPTPTPPPPPNYFTVAGCRLYDGSVAPGDSVVNLRTDCGVPPSAKTLAVTVSVIDPAGAGTVALRAADAAVDAAGATPLEFRAGLPRTGAAYLPLPADGSARVGVRNTAAGPVRVLLDLSGYFE